MIVSQGKNEEGGMNKWAMRVSYRELDGVTHTLTYVDE